MNTKSSLNSILLYYLYYSSGPSEVLKGGNTCCKLMLSLLLNPEDKTPASSLLNIIFNLELLLQAAAEMDVSLDQIHNFA